MAKKMLERREKTRLLGAKNKELKKPKKVKQDKQDEKVLWQENQRVKP